MDNELLYYLIFGILFIIFIGISVKECLDFKIEEKKEEIEKSEEEIEREFLNSVSDDSNYYEEIKKCEYLPNYKLNKYIPNKKIKVLVGDYMVNSIGNTVNILESMGIEVDTVKSGVGIIRKIKRGEQYDLIITNNIYDEGRCDGFQTMKRLKEIDDFNTPVIVLTISKGQRSKFISDGFDDYMEKYLTQQQVLDVFPKHISNLKFKKIREKNYMMNK